MATIFSMAQNTYSLYHLAQRPGMGAFSNAASRRLLASALPTGITARGGQNALLDAYSTLSLQQSRRALLKSYDETSKGFYQTFDKAMDGVQKNANALLKTDFNVKGTSEEQTKKNVDAVVNNVKGFITSYNDATKALSNYADVSPRLGAMPKLFGSAVSNSRSLASIGIYQNTQGGLTMDESKLRQALTSNPSRVGNLLGKGGLASKAEDRVAYVSGQRNNLFPSASDMLGKKYQQAATYTNRASLVSMNAYSNVGSLLQMFF